MADNNQHTISQSGVIPYRFNGDELEVMLITSRKKKKWIIPKGYIEPELKSRDSAKKEAYEEAGVFGEITGKPLGFFKTGSGVNVQVFALHVEAVLETWPEQRIRERQWFHFEDAKIRLHNKELLGILKRFKKRKLQYA